MSDYKKYGEHGSEFGGSETLKMAITCLAIGAGVGALVSLLFSPKSGYQLRQVVREKLNAACRGLADQTSRLRRRSTEIIGQTREKVTPISRTQ